MCAVAAIEIGFRFGFSWLFFTFAKDLKFELLALDNLAKEKANSDASIINRFCEIIKLHTDIKQLSADETNLLCNCIRYKIVFICRSFIDFCTAYKILFTLNLLGF